jgi:UDP-GlcNAc:undecaprenyl-phosphate GlcNAc-1-phosphate transferase
VTLMLAAAVVPALVAFITIVALRRSTLATRLADRPNERSLHVEPTPRLGGLAIAAGLLPFAAWEATQSPVFAAILACALGLLVVSLIDDLGGLPIEVRLPAHLCAALVAVLAAATPGMPWPWGWAGAFVAMLAIAWAANLYNFMDGADGLAGGMGVIGFGALAWAAADAGQVSLALLCTAISSACAGFLLQNAPPARVFMGDCGAIPLGFLAAALGLHGALAAAWPWWFAPFVFSPFIVDATLTLASRVARGQPFWRAHRDHGYQRLVLSGWSKRRLAIGAWGLMLAAAASALLARDSSGIERYVIIFVWLSAYALMAMAIGWLTKRKTQAARMDPPISRMP